MNQRPSLMDQAGINEPQNGAKGSSGGGPSAQTLKLGATIVLLLAVVAVLAYTTGLVGRGRPKIDKVEAAARHERIEEEIKAEKARDAKARVPHIEAGG